MKKIIGKSIEQSFSYSEYRVLVHDLLIEGKSTGFNQTELLTNFSLLNHKLDEKLNWVDSQFSEFNDISYIPRT